MTKILLALIPLIILSSFSQLEAQIRRPQKLRQPRIAVPKSREIGAAAVVMDETLSVLRLKPSLFAESVQRMRRGRKLQILGSAEADGVKFYRVAASPSGSGWVQADAVFGKFRDGDAERLARLIQASNGFDQIEMAAGFLQIYPESRLRPSILLLYGDLLEETAVKLSKDAAGRLDRREMAATGAPMHSYYLNFVMLDRYRKLGAVFLFDPLVRAYHYDGASWREIAAKYPAAPEAAEALKRLDSLKAKMQKQQALN